MTFGAAPTARRKSAVVPAAAVEESVIAQATQREVHPQRPRPAKRNYFFPPDERERITFKLLESGKLVGSTSVTRTLRGAGVELAAFAGRVTAPAGTTFRLPEVSMGLIPGAGGTASIPRRIGRWRTLYLALSGVVLDAATAAQWGLIDEVTW